MTARPEAQRGTTIIELMIALTILLVVMTGFTATLIQGVHANGIAYRRTVGTWLRSELVDRVSLSGRTAFVAVPGETWLVDQCFDGAGRPTAGNPALVKDFACGADDAYRRWLQITRQEQRVNDFGFAGPIWRVSVYVERISMGCTPETRYTTLGCTAADYYLTD